MKPFMIQEPTEPKVAANTKQQPKLDTTYFTNEQVEAIEKYVRDMIAFSTMYLTELFEPRQIMLKR